ARHPDRRRNRAPLSPHSWRRAQGLRIHDQGRVLCERAALSRRRPAVRLDRRFVLGAVHPRDRAHGRASGLDRQGRGRGPRAAAHLLRVSLAFPVPGEHEALGPLTRRVASRDEWIVALTWTGASILIWAARAWLPALAALAPDCPFHALTGLPCLACGTTRVALLLAAGDPMSAFLMNPLAAVALAATWI